MVLVLILINCVYRVHTRVVPEYTGGKELICWKTISTELIYTCRRYTAPTGRY